MTTVALVAPSSRGHHQTYTRHLAQTLLAHGHQVMALTPDAAELAAWLAAQDPAARARVRTFELGTPTNPRPPDFVRGLVGVLANKIAWIRFVAHEIQATGVQPDLVFHTWLDNCVTPGLTAALTDLVFPYRWSGLYFHPWYLRERLSYAALRRGPLSNHAALRSARCPAVAVLDEGIAPALQDQLHGKPVVIFPDIADASPPDPAYLPAQEIRRRAAGRTVVGLLGALSRRKGVFTLVEIARCAPRAEWFFVFAGELLADSFSAAEQAALADFVAKAPENCLFHFERIPDESQFNALVATCDILFAAYLSFLSSSNLLTKAALFEKPIVVSAGYCMGERVVRYRIGRAVPEDDPDAGLAALQEIVTLQRCNAGLPGADYAGYREAHSIPRLQEKFGELLAHAGLHE